MIYPDFIILFVDHPLNSAKFYSALLELEPVEHSPTFALFILPTGLRLGLWSRHTTEPNVAAASGATEVCFRHDSIASVDKAYENWGGRGLRILQTPVQMDFGYTFVATDPDGHRLRVYAMTEES
jgi:predicted enzyme related to lactoylglutathione lyase